MSHLSVVPTPQSTRRHPRVVVNLRATLDGARVTLGDLGPGGFNLRVSTEDSVSVQVGWTVFVHFRLLRTQICEGSGRVVWISRDAVGVELDDSNRSLDSFLRNLSRLPPDLRAVYLADVTDPEVAIIPAVAA